VKVLKGRTEFVVSHDGRFEVTARFILDALTEIARREGLELDDLFVSGIVVGTTITTIQVETA
jgi:hypothetical protein